MSTVGKFGVQWLDGEGERLRYHCQTCGYAWTVRRSNYAWWPISLRWHGRLLQAQRTHVKPQRWWGERLVAWHGVEINPRRWDFGRWFAWFLHVPLVSIQFGPLGERYVRRGHECPRCKTPSWLPPAVEVA